MQCMSCIWCPWCVMSGFAQWQRTAESEAGRRPHWERVVQQRWWPGECRLRDRQCTEQCTRRCWKLRCQWCELLLLLSLRFTAAGSEMWINKTAFQSKVDHPQIVYLLTLVWPLRSCDLDLYIRSWPIYSEDVSKIKFLGEGLECKQDRQTDSQTDMTKCITSYW